MEQGHSLNPKGLGALCQELGTITKMFTKQRANQKYKDQCISVLVCATTMGYLWWYMCTSNHNTERLCRRVAKFLN